MDLHNINDWENGCGDSECCDDTVTYLVYRSNADEKSLVDVWATEVRAQEAVDVGNAEETDGYWWSYEMKIN